MQKSLFGSEQELSELGFRRFAVLERRDLNVVAELDSKPAVYLATLDDHVFWVGETGNVRRRFSDYRRWFALPNDSPRADVKTRNKLLEMVNGRQLVFYCKTPLEIWSSLTAKNYPAHRVEETILIDYFKPAWNLRPGGRSRG